MTQHNKHSTAHDRVSMNNGEDREAMFNVIAHTKLQPNPGGGGHIHVCGRDKTHAPWDHEVALDDATRHVADVVLDGVDRVQGATGGEPRDGCHTTTGSQIAVVTKARTCHGKVQLPSTGRMSARRAGHAAREHATMEAGCDTHHRLACR